ncbi:DUF4202 domain-containing protein [Agaribacterium haliotis]|uniref:DUF4202 domain-containing protein n=1 Tax=Agaribacterium haliotis TaxID=2013869 RepID=UPI000BB58E6A|nr:DUF4202 domain-containing protein [Agaribacterium haliotis]
MSEQTQRCIALIDAANSLDPNIEQDDNGNDIAKELLYSQRMSAMLEQFAPDAGELVKIAVRAQHLERWRSARSDYPEGRAGYMKWRTELAALHAARCAELMAESGYDSDAQERVKVILRKVGIKRDADVQCLEDVSCLVFLQHYIDAFAAKYQYDEAKYIDIIQKTWAKMSEKGHAAALQLKYNEAIRSLIEKALS